ncbi:cupin-like domain-containing protein [Myxococcus qinghaiensis]|uniref:cupin-like domain-containing protein n=1 Tax=Myxococcus qinghaiensis TaxID=2906758 RepID=UPI0020A7BEFC|nr:cupin-like domain-containing protein [Myxococcus qinghaiensis]MCP3167968.1 cupin-like domain-containing protein [Myxococcus qinghaiensis]
MTPDERESLPPPVRSWLAENLTVGVDPSRLVQALQAQGLSEAQSREAVDAVASHPAVRHGQQAHVRRRELEGLLETRARLHAQRHPGPSPLGVERRRHLAPETFFERYYVTNRPVILEGVLDDWPALKRWSPEWLVERFGDEEVEVMAGRDAEPDPDFHAERLRHTLPLRELVAHVRGTPGSDDVYLVARNSLLLRAAFRPLLDDLTPPRGFIHPDLSAPDSVHLWFGPAGTLSNLHHDHLNVLFCQVLGRKRFWLAPPCETPRLYNDRGLYSAVDILAPDLGRFPDFARATLHSCVVGPGDALLIPVGWWHAVQALDVSLSVTFVSFDRPERNVEWRDYWIGPRPEKVQR